MGIQNLNSILKAVCPNAFYSLNITELSGKKIAIDAGIIMYKTMSICNKEVVNKTNVLCEDIDNAEIETNWYKKVIYNAMRFLEFNITPIYVFDGKPHYLKEKYARAKRGIIREKLKEDIKNIKNELSSNPLDNLPEKIKELQKKMSLDIKLNQNMLIKVLREIGIPCIVSNCEAERCCVSLCKDGVVDIVYSNDTDCLAWGCPYLMTDISQRLYDPIRGSSYYMCSMISQSYILLLLDITNDYFVDFCILCGCDYNKKIKGYGIMKLIDILKNKKTFDDLNITEEQIKQLEVDIIRKEIFIHLPHNELINDFGNILLDKEKIKQCRNLFSSLNIDGIINDLSVVIFNFKEINNNNILPKCGQSAFFNNL